MRAMEKEAGEITIKRNKLVENWKNLYTETFKQRLSEEKNTCEIKR